MVQAEVVRRAAGYSWIIREPLQHMRADLLTQEGAMSRGLRWFLILTLGVICAGLGAELAFAGGRNFVGYKVWSKADCKALVRWNDAYCDTADCKALIRGNDAYCKSGDCKAALRKNDAYCDTADCKAVIRSNDAYCDSSDCKAVIRNNDAYCKSSSCKAIVRDNDAYCN